MKSDPCLSHEWHPVALAASLFADKPLSVTLLGERIALWRTADGALHALHDQCPHRGAQLSMGWIRDGQMVCPYRGWRFKPDGECTLMPASPGFQPPARANAPAFNITEAMGLIWVCLGEAPEAPPAPPELASGYRVFPAGPYDVATSGPRAVENFLDIAHFSFVHDGFLGDETTTAASDYVLTATENGIAVRGIHAVQPKANVNAEGAVNIRYSYDVLASNAAYLTKAYATEERPTDIIMLCTQPVAEEFIKVWVVIGVNYDDHMPDSYFTDFQDLIFAQDKPVLESQRPRKLPLDISMEAHQRADQVSIAYRRYLASKGLEYGVIR